MPSESELREALRGVPAPSSSIDVASVIRRSKRRRLPRQIGIGGAAALAAVGITVAGVSSLRPPQAITMVASDTGETPARESAEDGAASPSGDGSGIALAPADKLHPCGGTIAEVAPNEAGLVLTPGFAAIASATGQPVSGTVTLSNTGASRVTGTTAATPAMTLSRDGVVLWHSSGPMIMLAVLVDLSPGQSMEYTASFTPVLCTNEEQLDGDPAALPALPPGSYDLTAAIMVTPEDGSAPQLVTGPPQTVTLQ